MRSPSMAPRLALLLLLFAGRASAQLSCAREEELVANLRWLREACQQEGEAFPEGDEDTLVPSAVTTAGCARVVHRVAHKKSSIIGPPQVAEGGGELCRAGRRLQADRSIAAAAGCSREGEAAGRAPEDKFVLKRNAFSSYFHCVFK